MKEARNIMKTPAVEPTLELIRNQFETWRRRRRCRSPIPESLWQAAVRLCRAHSICEVSRTLRLNFNDLKDRVVKARDTSVAVKPHPDLTLIKVGLGMPIGSSECIVEMEAPNGARMRMSLKGSLGECDPIDLSRVFWRQG
jgi:hypothetical protein